ncbi:MAG: hypothetical protein ACKVUS_14710 [Saprospiraceae bacterium]
MELTAEKIRTKVLSTESQRAQAVEESYKIFSLALDEYAEKYDLDEKSLRLLKGTLRDAFIERKASVYLEEHLLGFNEYLQNALEVSLQNMFQRQVKGTEMTRILYFNERNKVFGKLK